MEQNKINKAYPVLLRLGQFRFPAKKARQLYMLTKSVKEHFDFAFSEEQKYVAQYGGKYNEDGTVKFESIESFKGFQDSVAGLSASELEWDMPPVVLNDSDLGDNIISVSDICDLEGFVIFE